LGDQCGSDIDPGPAIVCHVVVDTHQVILARCKHVDGDVNVSRVPDLVRLERFGGDVVSGIVIVNE